MEKEQIRKDVIGQIAKFASMDSILIKDEYVLSEDPLFLDNTNLAFLTLELRAYVKRFKPEATVLVTEIRKKGLKVIGTIELISNKI